MKLTTDAPTPRAATAASAMIVVSARPTIAIVRFPAKYKYENYTEVAAKSLCSGRDGHQYATKVARQPEVAIIFRAYSDLRVSRQASGLLISTIVSDLYALKPVAR
jgi:hypothetical protein